MNRNKTVLGRIISFLAPISIISILISIFINPSEENQTMIIVSWIFFGISMLSAVLLIILNIIKNRQDRQLSILENKKNNNYEINLDQTPAEEEEIRRVFPILGLSSSVSFDESGMTVPFGNQDIKIPYENISGHLHRDRNSVTNQIFYLLLLDFPIVIQEDESEAVYRVGLTFNGDLYYWAKKYEINIENIDIVNDDPIVETQHSEFSFYNGKVIIKLLLLILFISIGALLIIVTKIHWSIILLLVLLPIITVIMTLLNGSRKLVITNANLSIKTFFKSSGHYIDYRDVVKVAILRYDEYLDSPLYHTNQYNGKVVVTTFDKINEKKHTHVMAIEGKLIIRLYICDDKIKAEIQKYLGNKIIIEQNY